MATPEALIPDARIRIFPDHDQVTIIQVREDPGGQFWTIVFRTADGKFDTVTLSAGELDQIEVAAAANGPTFDGDARRFRLGIEATRIRVGFQHDMAALAVSNIMPLPHQLEAVYGAFLEQPRLRFLLADDAGAGKTIMSGLYMKELQLRRAAERILIVAPANLRPQWERELSERFKIEFTQMNRAVYDASPTQNAWDVYDYLIVSRDFLRDEEILDSFTQAERDWDLAIVDEAHGFTLQVDAKGAIKKRSDRYKAAERVAEKAHRLILLTATPHSGKNESLWGLLRLLDADAYGERCPPRIEINPRQYRKVTKEEMRDLRGQKLFKPRYPHTLGYELRGAELDLYDAVTEFVCEKLAEIRGGDHRGAGGFALTAMQRRLASSVRAIRRTLERRVARLEKALEDPAEWLRKQKSFQATYIPGEDELADLAEEDLWRLEEKALEETLPETEQALRLDLEESRRLLALAEETEERSTEPKLNQLLDVVHEQGLKDDPSKKLLIFTEHKDTLKYLVEKLAPDFELTEIHGDMRLGDRIAAENDFRERAQIMVATEAAGEGINLQFCHLMVNYDIPWNPNRLEQRMGRIHRIGQTDDVHIFNLVATNTKEGYVLATILRKMEQMGKTLGDSVFDVIGTLFAGYRLSDLLEEVLAGEITKEEAAERIGDDIDPEIKKRAEQLLGKALATEHIDWELLADRAARAEERRLPAGYLERFFTDAIDAAGGKCEKRHDGALRVVRTPDQLVVRSWNAGATRRIRPNYERLTFDKQVAMRPRTTEEEHRLPRAELCGPGHPLFDALVSETANEVEADVRRGATFASTTATEPQIIHFLTGDALDGNDELVHRTFASVTEEPAGYDQARRFLYDLVPENGPGDSAPDQPVTTDAIVGWARAHILERRFQEVKEERDHVVSVQEDFLRKSFSAMLVHADEVLLELDAEVERHAQGAEGRLRQAELSKAALREKRDRRLAETARGRQVWRGPVRLLGSALVVPVPTDPAEVGEAAGDEAHGLSNQEIEQIAVGVAKAYEERRGVDYLRSVEAENIGFDLLSVSGISRRCIEVKGRAGMGSVTLSWSELAKAIELGNDYWLYVVLDCATSSPRLYRVQDPAKTLSQAWKTNLDVSYQVAPGPVIDASEGT